MAHTFNAPGGTIFHFNNDLSGDVEVLVDGGSRHFEVPGADLVAFIAQWVRDQRVAELEQATDADVLGLKEVPSP